MRFLVLAILLAFPLADLYVTSRVARWAGIPLWIFLSGSFLAGLLLLHNERIAFRTRTVAALHGEQSLLRGLLDSGRKVLAGFLLILPGLVTDVMALLLLALPLNIGRNFGPQPATAGRPSPSRGGYDAIDGEYRRVE
jgi:UPF0716 protein FxsA